MTNMQDIFGVWWAQKFEKAEQDGLITIRHHPKYSQLVIANYTPKAAYEGTWTDVTLASRGLIYDNVLGRIHARPLAKFFNYGQTGAPAVTLDQEVAAANKYDGSLGIAYRDFDGVIAIATRGSFASEQAIHATEVFQRAENRSEYLWASEELDDDWTPLFEIIYPENRIVLDYGKKDYLQYLGSIRNPSGAFFPNDEEVLTFGELLSRAPRPNAEGYVVWLNRHDAIKIKQEDYVALHAIVTGLNEKAVWRAIKEGMPSFNEFVAKLPDELQPWAESVGSDLAHQYGAIVRELDLWYLKAVDVAWGYTDQSADIIPRKELALAIQDVVPGEYRGFMFSIADGKDYQDKVWKMIEPKGTGSRPSNALADEE